LSLITKLFQELSNFSLKKETQGLSEKKQYILLIQTQKVGKKLPFIANVNKKFKEIETSAQNPAFFCPQGLQNQHFGLNTYNRFSFLSQ